MDGAGFAGQGMTFVSRVLLPGVRFVGTTYRKGPLQGNLPVGNTLLPGRMQTRALPALTSRSTGGGRAGAAQPCFGLFPPKPSVSSAGARVDELNGLQGMGFH